MSTSEARATSASTLTVAERRSGGPITGANSSAPCRARRRNRAARCVETLGLRPWVASHASISTFPNRPEANPRAVPVSRERHFRKRRNSYTCAASALPPARAESRSRQRQGHTETRRSALHLPGKQPRSTCPEPHFRDGGIVYSPHFQGADALRAWAQSGSRADDHALALAPLCFSRAIGLCVRSGIRLSRPWISFNARTTRTSMARSALCPASMRSTVRLETPASSASCAWVRLASMRRRCRRAPSSCRTAHQSSRW